MTWEVTMFPKEQEFIDTVFSKLLDNHDGRGEFIAPLRGGLIYLDNYRSMGLNDNQVKWLVFNELQDLRFQIPGFVGIKFMNFNWNGIVPSVEEDAEAMDKWGVKRQTSDGQPIGITGLPIDRVETRQMSYQDYKWDSDKKAYVGCQGQSGMIEIRDCATEARLSERILEVEGD